MHNRSKQVFRPFTYLLLPGGVGPRQASPSFLLHLLSPLLVGWPTRIGASRPRLQDRLTSTQLAALQPLDQRRSGSGNSAATSTMPWPATWSPTCPWAFSSRGGRLRARSSRPWREPRRDASRPSPSDSRRAYADFDERAYARLVARQYGTDHEELEVEPHIGDTDSRLGPIFDEPMGDSGAVPNLLVCAWLASGSRSPCPASAATSSMRGYQRYLGCLARRMVPERSHGPYARGCRPATRRTHPGITKRDARSRPGEAICAGRGSTLDRTVLRLLQPDRPRPGGVALYSRALRERVEIDSALERMRALAERASGADLLNRLLAVDQQMYLVDDLLTVADRTSMAVSLELRVPFLDHPLVEFMAQVTRPAEDQGEPQEVLLEAGVCRRPAPEDPRSQEVRVSASRVARWLREDLRGLIDDCLVP